MFTALLYGNNHDFSGTAIGNELAWISQIRFNNFWSIHGDVYANPESLSNTALRGGPRVIVPSSINFYHWGFHTDSRKSTTIGPHVSYKYLDNGGYVKGFDVEFGDAGKDVEDYYVVELTGEACWVSVLTKPFNSDKLSEKVIGLLGRAPPGTDKTEV